MNSSRKENGKGYLFIAPAIFFIFFVYFFPLFQNLRYSFLDLAQAGRPFVGIRNYFLMLNDELFWMSLRNNLFLMLLVPILVFLSLFFSVLLFEQIRGWKIYRSIVLLPYITSITAIGIFFSLFFQGRGILNTFLKIIGLEKLIVDWLGSTVFALPTIMLVILWREFGFGTMLFLARLMTVSEEIFDAAKIDGTNWLQRLWYIVIPQLGTVIEFYVFIALITMLSWVFNYVYVMTLGGPAHSTYVTEYYIFIQAFKMNHMAVASAVAIVLFILAALLSFMSHRLRIRIYKEYE